MFRLRRDRRAAPPVPEAVPPAPGAGEEPGARGRIDERLARAAGEGDLDAFNLLVLRHECAVFGLCLRLLRDVPAAEAAARGAFVAAWTGIAAFRGGPVRGWLLRAAVDRCDDPKRAGFRRSSAVLDAEPPTLDAVPLEGEGGVAEVDALRAELAILLERAVAALPEEPRLVVLLVDVTGCDDDEVAVVTGAAAGTVASRLVRGRARLRQALGDDPAGRVPFARFARLLEEGAGGGSGTGKDGASRGPAWHLDLDAQAAFVDGRLDDADGRAVEDHLAGCPDCHREVVELRATVSLLRGLPRYVPRRSFRLGPDHAAALPDGRLARLLPALTAATAIGRCSRGPRPPFRRG